MKKVYPTLLSMGLLLPALSQADDPEVKVTSFYFTGPASFRTAEICGVVNGKWTEKHRVVVSVDPGPRMGTYVTWPGPAGRWCTLVESKTGRAEVGLWSGGDATPSQAAVEVTALDHRAVGLVTSSSLQ